MADLEFRDAFLQNVRVYARRFGAECSAERAEKAFKRLSSSPVFGQSRKEAMYAASMMAGMTHTQAVGVSLYLYTAWYADIPDFMSGRRPSEAIMSLFATTSYLGELWVRKWLDDRCLQNKWVDDAVQTALTAREVERSHNDSGNMTAGFAQLTHAIKMKARGY